MILLSSHSINIHINYIREHSYKGPHESLNMDTDFSLTTWIQIQSLWGEKMQLGISFVSNTLLHIIA